MNEQKNHLEVSRFPVKESSLLLMIPILFGIFLRFIDLQKHSLWADEAFSVMLAGSSWTQILKELMTDSSPPLYYLILKIWIMLFGNSEYAVRSLSALCSSITLIAAASLTLRLTRNIRLSMLVTTFLALSPAQIYFAMETRAYAMAAMFFMLAVTGIQTREQTGSNSWIVVPAITASIYTHNYGWLFWGCTILWTLFNKRNTRIGWIHHLLIGFICLPWVPGLISQLKSGTTAWVPPAKPIHLLQIMYSYAGKSQFMKTPFPYDLIAAISTVCLVALLGRILIGEISRPSRGLDLTLLGFGVLIAAFLLSFRKPMLLPGRHDLMAMAPIAVLAAGSFVRQKRDGSISQKDSTLLVSGICAGILLCCQAALLFHYFADFQKANDRTVAEAIEKLNLPDSTIIISTDVTHTSLSYYLKADKYRIIPFPSCGKGYLSMDFLTCKKDYIESEIAVLLRDIQQSNRNARVVFAHAGKLSGVDQLLDSLRKIWKQELIVPVESPRPYNSVFQIILFALPSEWDVPDRTAEPQHP